MNLDSKSDDELFDLLDHKEEMHSQAREASRSDNGIKVWEDQMKNLLDDMRQIEDELLDRDLIQL